MYKARCVNLGFANALKEIFHMLCSSVACFKECAD